MGSLLLTQSSFFIIGPIAKVLGLIMEWLYNIFSSMGIHNIGLCIIFFTLVVKLLMLPLTIKQQKFSKVSSVMNPEIQVVQKKYQGKRDNESMVKMQAEMKAIYAKYGTSPTGGCVQILIQMPILFALYQVIIRIPAYVPDIKKLYENIRNALPESYITDTMNITVEGVDPDAVTNSVIDKLTNLKQSGWTELTENFNASTAEVITSNHDRIADINSFLGINLTESPGALMGIALLIPLLSGLLQWYSTVLMTRSNTSMNADNPMASSMKTMNVIMPIMSVFFCYSFASGIGLYWVANSVFTIIQQISINKYFEKVDINDIIKKNVERINKRGGQGNSANKSGKVSAAVNYSTKNIKSTNSETTSSQNTNNEKSESSTVQSYTKRGNLASKANLVKAYNEKNSKK